MSAALTPFGRAFQPLFDRVLAQLDEAARPALRRCAMRSRLGPQRDAAQQEHISKKLKVAPTLAGDKYLAEIREILASKLGLKRSTVQIRFHESFLQAISRILYRSDGAQADMSAIMQREKWSDLQQQVCCLTPRRFGKTTAVAMFAAAVAMTLPTVEIAIFSTGRRASSTWMPDAAGLDLSTHFFCSCLFLACRAGKLLEQIAELVLNNNPKWVDRVGKNNQESFWLKHAADNGATSLAKVRCR